LQKIFFFFLGGGSTFGYEKVVYWRDTAAGMRTIPYFFAKFIADIPRLIIAAAMFTCSFILFYPYRASIFEIYVIILLAYFAAWTMGTVHIKNFFMFYQIISNILII
jgi:hypothetical protein